MIIIIIIIIIIYSGVCLDTQFNPMDCGAHNSQIYEVMDEMEPMDYIKA
jgi:hypothetical protein